MSDTRRIIINADDFGQTKAINEAVIDAHQNGVLTSVTIMANMPHFEEAAAEAKKNPNLGVGVHLNLMRGRPLCDPSEIPTLVDKNGNLLGSVTSIWKQLFMGELSAKQLEMEFQAQVQKVIDSGIKPTHVDSEKHLHLVFPFVGRIACLVAKKFDIPCIRVGREKLHLNYRPARTTLNQTLKAYLISHRSRPFSHVAKDFGLRFTDRFTGVALTGNMTFDAYRFILAHTGPGTLEIMTHPAIRSGAEAIINEASWLDVHRPDEYRALTDDRVREAFAGSGVSLIHYGEL